MKYILISLLILSLNLTAEEVEIYNEQTNEATYIDVTDTRVYDHHTEVDTYNYDTNEYNIYSISIDHSDQQE